MGTAISVDVRDPWVNPSAVDAAFAHFRDVDTRFSTFKPDSEISRLARRDVTPRACSPDVREVLALCEEARRKTAGYFDIRRHRLDGGLDPSGLVKGWSIEGAARILEAAGARNFCINAGGDVVARGEAEPGRPWRVGIRHPIDADRLAAVVLARDLAVATSGAYERGQHVLDPHTKRPPEGVLSVTVVGPSITWADTYATALFAMGTDGVRWAAETLPDYPACCITTDRRLLWTEGFAQFLERS